MIHVILGLVLYCQLKKNINHFSAFIIMILHLNFLPKWVQLPEFELMHYWCLLGIFLVLYAYFLKGNLVARHWYIKARMLLPFLGGCLLVCSMFCYPTMIFLYPFYILALYVLERHYNKIRGSKVWRSSISFTVGAFLTGFLFVIHLFSYMSLDELKRYISYIFMDTSHNLYTMGEKWAIYLEQIQGQTKEYSVYILVGAGIMLVFFLFGKLIFGKRISFHMHTDILHIAVTVLLITGFLMQVTAVYGFLFEDKNQFFLQTRYIAILLPAVLLGMYNYKKMTIWLWLCVVPGIMSVPAVLFVTNMDTNITYAKAFLGVLGSFLIFEQYWREIPKNSIWRKIFPFIQYVTCGMVLAGLLVCRLILIRVSGCLPVTIRAPLEKMESGPEKGIYVLADTAKVWNDNYRVLDTCIKKEDTVLYIGAENLVYVHMGALLATPSTQGTVVYNEMFLRYYEEHSDRIPNVIIYDKTFGENPVYALSYAFSLQDSMLYRWINENYQEAQIKETDHLLILRLEKYNSP